MKNIEFNYQVPITERETIGNDFIINGVAINATTTGNNHKFIAEELERAAPSLKGVPLLVDHKNEINAIKGRVNESIYNSSAQSILFKARVMDKAVREMIQDGRINSVSIGAAVTEIEEDTEDGTLIPRGIVFKELSLVAVPADPNATFTMALSEALDMKIKEKKEENESQSQMKGGNKIVATAKITEEREETKLIESQTKVEEAKVEESAEMISMRQKLQEVESQLAVYKQKERKQLEEKYKGLCESKSLKSLDVSLMDDKTIEMLMQQIESVQAMPKIEEKVEEKVDESEEKVISKATGYKIVEDRGTLFGGAFYITQ